MLATIAEAAASGEATILLDLNWDRFGDRNPDLGPYMATLAQVLEQHLGARRVDSGELAFLAIAR